MTPNDFGFDFDPNSPNFPIGQEHVYTIRTLMMGRNENMLRSFLHQLAQQEVPVGLLAVICAFTFATLPDQVQEFWKPIASLWDEAIPPEIKEAMDHFIEHRYRKDNPSRSQFDIHLGKMLHASMPPEKAALLRSKASVN